MTDTKTTREGFSLHEKIDVCRGLFAALVVMAHGLEVSWKVSPASIATTPEWLRNFLFCVFGTGTYYVMGFFVLSGYCIHLSVARSMKEERFPVKQYLAARMTRILPLYYIGLLATLAVEWLISDVRPREWPHGLDVGTFVAQVFMVQNLKETFGAYASTWSITNEVFYYLFYGLLACLAAGRPSRPAWVGMAACVAVAMVTQTLYVTIGRNPFVYKTGMLMGLGMLWFMGALVAIHGKEWVKNAWVVRGTAVWPVVLAVAIVWKTLNLTPHGLYLISGLAFTLMLLRMIAKSPEKAPANAGRLRTEGIALMGLASYPLYLFHGPVQMLVGSWLMRVSFVADWRMTWAIMVAAGLVSGTALGWYLERPVMAWRAATLRRLREKSAGARTVPGRPVAALRTPAMGVGARS